MQTAQPETPYSLIDIDNWKRKGQFEFFNTFESPHFNLTANVDITRYRAFCRQNGHSFFLATVHAALATANALDNFRYRIAGAEVRDYASVQAGVTILQPDETFIYCTLPYEADFETFLQKSQEAIDEQKRSRGFQPHARLDMVFFSAIPWVSFTSVQHAMNQSPTVCIPRVVIGKYFEAGDRLLMPLAVQVHHAVADGFHVGKFFEQLQERLDGVAITRTV